MRIFTLQHKSFAIAVLQIHRMLKHLLTLWQKYFGKSKDNLPIDKPTEANLKRWACSEWIEYQAWLFHHGFLTLHDWQQLRDNALSWQNVH